MENITTIEQMEKICPVQFRARGLDRVHNRLNNIKAEITEPYAKNEVYLLSLGDTILACIDTMPALLQELAEYGEICSHDNNICLSCINGIYYLDMLGHKTPVEYNNAEIAIRRFIDLIMEG
jgi:hypothetical protein